MRQTISRRFGALVLALAMALSLAVTPAWAVDTGTTSFSVTLAVKDSGSNTAKVGETITLEATLANAPTDTTLTAHWDTNPPADSGTFTVETGSDNATYVMKGAKAGKVKVSVWYSDAADNTNAELARSNEVEVEWTEDTTSGEIEATGISLNKTTLPMTLGGASETLTVTFTPTDTTDKTVTWSSSDDTVATVSGDGEVTPVGLGTATITAKTKNDKTATCNVTVSTAVVTGLSFAQSGDYVWSTRDGSPWELTVNCTPANAEDKDQITWTVTTRDPTETRTWDEIVSVSKGEDGNVNATGPSIKVTNLTPGEVVFTATAPGGATASKNVTISGILLTTDRLEEKKVSMLVGESKMIGVDKSYGFAANGSGSDIVWMSSDPSTVTVTDGELVAWKLGTATITVTKNGYSARCEVEVVEDIESVITVNDPSNPVTYSRPLTFDRVYDRLNQISIDRTRVTDAVGTVTQEGSPLNYITNVTVSTDQGTLYYNYNSEANTGAGVAATDRFAKVVDTDAPKTLDRLYFVPRQGFSGEAEITFNGWSVSGSSFSGTVKVMVQGSAGISYRTTMGEPVYFQSGDFNSYCRTVMGRDLSYVTFTLPSSSEGVLYYNYTNENQFGGRVTTSTQYGRSGRNTIEDVCFVPGAAFTGEVKVGYRGVDTGGGAFNGTVTITVSPASAEGDTANVYLSVQQGETVTFPTNLFNAACQATIRDTLSYVRFGLPSFSEGTLYYNYRGPGSFDSRVDTTTRYYYSGSPGISGITMVPASNDARQVAIPYTGYGVGGTTYTGKVFITFGNTNRGIIRYSLNKNAEIRFTPNDFISAGILQMGTGVEYVEFQVPENTSRPDLEPWRLYYREDGSAYDTDVGSGTEYYCNPRDSYQNRLSNITFRAGESACTVMIPYKAYSTEDSAGRRKSFEGMVVVQVGAPTPADVSLSTHTSEQVWLSSYSLRSVCGIVMDKGLSYIQITGLPEEETGRLYDGYIGYKTGLQVKAGDRFYCVGAPGIDDLSFVPRGGFEGRAEIDYVGYSSDGQEQVSGKIIVNVSKSAASRYFNDMGRHLWAADAVDYLYANDTVNGVGGGRYNPAGRITKGDFTLMLVRAFGFRANGTLSYSDVPADSYYADAIRIAGLKGITGGSGGRFYPKAALTRQDAMTMIYNALSASGWTLTNGLAADLSVYHDERQIANYARRAIGTLVQMGIVQGDGNGYLRPQSYLSRAETAMLMHSIMTL